LGERMAPEMCAEVPALCTGVAFMQGIATTLTYVCPQTTGPGTTVHHTVTVTTTVPAPSDTAVIPPK
jgi:hypothetical protein